MKKNCYFCKHADTTNFVCDSCTGRYETLSNFEPNDEWLEYEKLLEIKQLAKDLVKLLSLLQEEADSGFDVISVEQRAKMIDSIDDTREKLVKLLEEK